MIEHSYLDGEVFDESFERTGLRIRFRGWTFSLQAYSEALEEAGFVIERIREPRQTLVAVQEDPAEARWRRLANFLFIRARRH